MEPASTSFNVNVTLENVKKPYQIMEIVTGFDWDGTKHMIIVENENAWNEYCTIRFDFFFQSHKLAKPFRFEVLQNWDDIVDLCAKDRAGRHGAETAMDVDEAMSRETNEVEFMSLNASATIDLEEPNSNTKGEGQGSTSFGTHSHKEKDWRKEGMNNNFFG
ncbi:hypothetical protein HKD37_02G005068 [Glycine soja]